MPEMENILNKRSFICKCLNLKNSHSKAFPTDLLNCVNRSLNRIYLIPLVLLSSPLQISIPTTTATKWERKKAKPLHPRVPLHWLSATAGHSWRVLIVRLPLTRTSYSHAGKTRVGSSSLSRQIHTHARGKTRRDFPGNDRKPRRCLRER